MRHKNAILLSVAGLCLAGAILLAVKSLARSESASQDFPDGTFWYCTDCKQGFGKSAAEVLDMANAARDAGVAGTSYIQCPSCNGRNVVRAWRCPVCQTISPRPSSGPSICPKCQK